MSSETAIRITDLSKSYRIRHEAGDRPTNLAELISRRLRKPLQRASIEEFWALKEINLDIKQGEVVGVIGRNGAGKSTLLKILSRITEPTRGRVELFGRVGSLLEVGTGFHPELTGRENIYLNGAILGMRRSEITRQFDAIVDFAGVEKFLDTPVKRYSSGMYVRLAFAVAAHLNPEILIVDEVLAVGDTEFQKKCLGKMQDVAQSGRTVLFVSHNMAAVKRLCSTAIHLSNGQIGCVGPCTEVADAYTKQMTDGGNGDTPFSSGPYTLRIVKTSVIRDRDGFALEVLIDVSSKVLVSNLGVGIHLHDSAGHRLSYLMPELLDTSFGLLEPGKTKRFVVRVASLETHLASGRYVLGVSLHEYQYCTLLQVDFAASFDVPEVAVFGTNYAPRLAWSGPIPLPAKIAEASTRSSSELGS